MCDYARVINFRTIISIVTVVCSGIKGRCQQVIEAIMVAMSSAMCAFFLIYFDRSCQERGKDPNEHPLQVAPITLSIHYRSKV